MLLLFDLIRSIPFRPRSISREQDSTQQREAILVDRSLSIATDGHRGAIGTIHRALEV
jgi:hypothetical protein